MIFLREKKKKRKKQLEGKFVERESVSIGC